METYVKKWGNSLGIRLPMSIANNTNLVDGSRVSLVLRKNKIEIIPVDPDSYSLDDMLSEINDSNIHQEIDMGSAGKELL